MPKWLDIIQVSHIRTFVLARIRCDSTRNIRTRPPLSNPPPSPPLPPHPTPLLTSLVQVAGNWSVADDGGVNGSFLTYTASNPTDIIAKIDPLNPNAAGLGWVTLGLVGDKYVGGGVQVSGVSHDGAIR